MSRPTPSPSRAGRRPRTSSTSTGCARLPRRPSRTTRRARPRTAPPSATSRCASGSPSSTASTCRRSSSPTGRCRPTRSSSTRSSSPATRSSSSGRRTTARCSACASAAPTSGMIDLEPDGIDVDELAKRARRAACARSSRTSSPTSRTRPATRSRARSATGCCTSRATYDFVHLRGRPVRRSCASRARRCRRCSRSTETDRVVYASSFSKTVCPGIRVGYLVGPADLIAQDRQAARRTRTSRRTWSPSRSSTSSAASGRIRGSIETVKNALAERVERARRRRSQRELPDARFAAARGRLLHVGRAARGRRRRRAVHRGRRARRRVRQGHRTSCSRAARNTLRLAYSGVTADQIDEGVARLAEAVRAATGVAQTA